MTDEKPTHPLTAYRGKEKQTLEAFAMKVGASKGTVWKWENGTIPRPAQMQKIVEVTDGKVGPSDWYAGVTAA